MNLLASRFPSRAIRLSPSSLSLPNRVHLPLRFLKSGISRTMSTSVAAGPFQALERPWNARMQAQHGWLLTFLTFSFAGQYDPKWTSFGPLRVVNEDRIVGQGNGFPTHRHAEFEIFSYVLGGELTHRDSMGNGETLKRGQIQYTRAGTGIAHSEYNHGAPANSVTHFMQIWFRPDKKYRRVKPEYFSTQTPEDLKRNKLVTLIRPSSTVQSDKTGLLAPGEAIPAHTSIVVRASLLDKPATTVTHTWGTDSDVAQEAGQERWGVVHLAMRSGYKDPTRSRGTLTPLLAGEARIRVYRGSKDEAGQGVQQHWDLREGDSLFFKGVQVGEKLEIEKLGEEKDKEAEFLLFDMRPGKEDEDEDY